MMRFRPSRLSSGIAAGFVIGLLLGVTGASSGAAVPGSRIFRDVPSGAFYDAAVGEMYERGIIRGYDADTFGPNDTVTRGQMAVLMQRLRNDLLKEVSSAAAVRSSASSSRTSHSSASSVSSRSSVSSASSASSTSSQPSVTLQLGAATYTVEEQAGSLTVIIERTGITSVSVGVSYATANGTATAGAEYTATSGTVTFGPGETSKSLSIPILDNSMLQGNKTFTVTLSAPTGGASLGHVKSATVSIADDENDTLAFGTGSLKFAKSAYTVDERDRVALITVQRVGGTRGTVTVAVATSNITAFSGLDYTALSTTLTFAPFESSKVIAIPIVDDTTNEEDEMFSITLSSPSGGAELLSPTSTQVTITD